MALALALNISLHPTVYNSMGNRFVLAIGLSLSLLLTYGAARRTFVKPAVAPCPAADAASGTEQSAPHAWIVKIPQLHQRPSPQNPAAGLYLFEDHVDLANWRRMYHAAIPASYINGAAIMLNWKSLEPSPRHFRWEALDLELNDVLRLGKTFTIGVIAGGQAPTWLYTSEGVPGLRHITFNPTLNKQGIGCQKLDQPLVWDDRYQRQYAMVMVALAQHLRSIPLPSPQHGTAFDALLAVKLSGINVGTEELRMDTHPATPDLSACQEPDVTALWRNSGYRPQSVFHAWAEIADMTARAYPNKLLNMDVIPNAAFPDIDAQGNVYPAPNGPGKKHTVEPLNAEILNYAVSTYGKRLMVQWDALSQDRILPVEVLSSGQRGALTGWQMNGFGGGNFAGSGCIYPPFHTAPCRSLDDFAQALLDGIDAGGCYIEVQPPDVAVQFLNPPNPNIKDFTPAFEKAQQAIHTSSSPRLPFD